MQFSNAELNKTNFETNFEHLTVFPNKCFSKPFKLD